MKNKTIELLLSTKYISLENVEYIRVIRRKQKIDVMRVANNIYSFGQVAILIFKIKSKAEEQLLVSDLDIFSEEGKITITGNEVNKEIVLEKIKNKKDLKKMKLKKNNDSFFGKTEWNISAIENKKIIEFSKIKNLKKILEGNNGSN
ncbi:hypothetical protein [Mycoplasma todarodis]|uniref:Uncharacterized protein n=1 Tax=Mycoplasma todarodis TaxID=1937191 RepID=A0A4R0XW73_9MOLU|nr:hypothetical protein [Mycoplasma todarodis]TCG12067.1 hypothetical protein C4B25_00030 [Mycoplasma todarodis]